MACDCLRDLNEQLLEHNTRICEAFMPGIVDPVVVIQFERLADDQAEISIVAPNFCPFCGERYGHDPAIGISAAGGEVVTHVH